MESCMETQQNIIDGFEIINVNEQTHDNCIFSTMDVAECYYKIGIEFEPEDRMSIDYRINNFSEVFKERYLKTNKRFHIIFNQIETIELLKRIIEYTYLILDIKVIT